MAEHENIYHIKNMTLYTQQHLLQSSGLVHPPSLLPPSSRPITFLQLIIPLPPVLSGLWAQITLPPSMLLVLHLTDKLDGTLKGRVYIHSQCINSIQSEQALVHPSSHERIRITPTCMCYYILTPDKMKVACSF
jgi:hypothetical protein